MNGLLAQSEGQTHSLMKTNLLSRTLLVREPIIFVGKLRTAVSLDLSWDPEKIFIGTGSKITNEWY